MQIEAHKALCEECAAYGLYSEPVMDVSRDLDVNVANTNAQMLLAALGIEVEHDGDLSGIVDGEVFLGAVLLAMAADRDDTGVAPVDTYAGVGRGARWIACGVRPGYFADRFGAMHALAAEAGRLGRSEVFS